MKIGIDLFIVLGKEMNFIQQYSTLYILNSNLHLVQVLFIDDLCVKGLLKQLERGGGKIERFCNLSIRLNRL